MMIQGYTFDDKPILCDVVLVKSQGWSQMFRADSYIFVDKMTDRPLHYMRGVFRYTHAATMFDAYTKRELRNLGYRVGRHRRGLTNDFYELETVGK